MDAFPSWKVMEKSWNFVFEFVREPCYFHSRDLGRYYWLKHERINDRSRSIHTSIFFKQIKYMQTNYNLHIIHVKRAHRLYSNLNNVYQSLWFIKIKSCMQLKLVKPLLHIPVHTSTSMIPVHTCFCLINIRHTIKIMLKQH